MVVGGRSRLESDAEVLRSAEPVFLESAETFDPSSGRWSATAALTVARGDHSAVRLDDGRVLVTGGWALGEPDPASGSRPLDYFDTSEVYDPSTGSWSQAGSMSVARRGHIAVLLPDGKVLVAGGENDDGGTPSAELYDARTDEWSPTGDMLRPRGSPTATLLRDGRVLVVGGVEGTAEIYDPSTGQWSGTGSMSIKTTGAGAALMTDGRVLVAGGFGGRGGLAFVELYDPASGVWEPAQGMPSTRIGPTATTLPGGAVLIVGGRPTLALLFDPPNAASTWIDAGNLGVSRRDHTATLLDDGRVIIVGGEGRNSGILGSSEIYTP